MEINLKDASQVTKSIEGRLKRLVPMRMNNDKLKLIIMMNWLKLMSN